MNISISECRKMPIQVRKWFVNRSIEQINNQKLSPKKQSQTKQKNNSANPAKDIDIGKVNKFFKKFEK